jgi:galactarate dehydratase
VPPLEGFTFEGFRNPDGSVGTKNILGISTSVQCVRGTLDYAVKKIRSELLPNYPNVDDVVALTHAYGCGVAITAPDAVVPIRTLQNLALNPNFGGEILVVGLGCEKLAPERLVPEGSDAIVRMQDEAFDGFGAIVKAITSQAEARLKVLNKRQRETCSASDLVIDLQCGSSDAFSGVTANPAVGFAADLLVRAGATVMFSEVTEVRDAIELLTRRAVNEDVGRALIREMAWVRRLSRPRRRRSQRQHYAGQQEGRSCQYRREIAWLDREIRFQPDRWRARAR